VPRGDFWLHSAPSTSKAAHLGHDAVSPGALRRRSPRDPRVLVRRPPDPRGVPDRPGRSARRRRRARLQRQGRL